MTKSELYLLLNMRSNDRPLWLVGACLPEDDLRGANLWGRA